MDESHLPKLTAWGHNGVPGEFLRWCSRFSSPNKDAYPEEEKFQGEWAVRRACENLAREILSLDGTPNARGKSKGRRQAKARHKAVAYMAATTYFNRGKPLSPEVLFLLFQCLDLKEHHQIKGGLPLDFLKELLQDKSLPQITGNGGGANNLEVISQVVYDDDLNEKPIKITGLQEKFLDLAQFEGQNPNHVMSDTDICRKYEIDPKTLQKWRKNKTFKERVRANSSARISGGKLAANMRERFSRETDGD